MRLHPDLGVSGPLAVVVAGLLVGSRGPRDALSDRTQRYLFGFWTLIDEMLNSILFLLIGLEVLVLRFEPVFGWLMALSVPLVLIARLAAVSGPILLLGLFHKFARGTIPVLTGAACGAVSRWRWRFLCQRSRRNLRCWPQHMLSFYLPDRSGIEPACGD